MPAISVLMTVYNAAEFVERSVRSIVSQSFDDFVLIIVDDGSTDNSAAIIRSIHDDRIQFRQIDHLGRAGALNVALGRVSTPYAAIMDADDVSHERRLEKEYGYLAGHPAVGIVGTAFTVISRDGKVISAHSFAEHDDGIKRGMIPMYSCLFGSVMFRTGSLPPAPVFDERLECAVDYDFFLKMVDVTEFHNLPERLYAYRSVRSSLTRSRPVQVDATIRRLSHAYLAPKLKSGNAKGDVSFSQGLTEYYRGSIPEARRYLKEALDAGYDRGRVYRYYLPTCLGEPVFHGLRYIYNALRSAGALFVLHS